MEALHVFTHARPGMGERLGALGFGRMRNGGEPGVTTRGAPFECNSLTNKGLDWPLREAL